MATNTQDQLFPFAVVGITSSAIYLLLVFCMVRFLSLSPLIANIIGYAITVNVSFLGHKYYTFAGLKTTLRFIPYLIISLIAFFLNELLYFIFLDYLFINYLISLTIVIILVAIFTFFASKWWACR